MLEYIFRPFVILAHIFKPMNMGESLERYIVSNDPKDEADVERLTIEWQRRQNSIWMDNTHI